MRGVWCTCGPSSRAPGLLAGSLLQLQQQLLSDPSEVLQRPEEGVESPGSARRQGVQEPESLLPAGGQSLDVLHLGPGQNVLLVQERDDGVADQKLGRQLQPVLPQQSSVFRLHLASPPVPDAVCCLANGSDVKHERGTMFPAFRVSRFSFILREKLANLMDEVVPNSVAFGLGASRGCTIISTLRLDCHVIRVWSRPFSDVTMISR